LHASHPRNHAAITAGGLISANAFGKSVAGDVTLTADSLLIDGISFDSPFTGILAIAEFGSSGDAGSITVHAGNLKIIRFGEIRTDTFGKGNAGDLTVTGNSLLIYYGAGIFADSSGDNSGDAGSVVVRAGNLTLTLGGSINLSSNGTGNAGDVLDRLIERPVSTEQ